MGIHAFHGCAVVAESGAPRDIAGRTGEEEGAESTTVRNSDDPLGRYRPASCILLSRVTRALSLSLSPSPSSAAAEPANEAGLLASQRAAQIRCPAECSAGSTYQISACFPRC